MVVSKVRPKDSEESKTALLQAAAFQLSRQRASEDQMLNRMPMIIRMMMMMTISLTSSSLLESRSHPGYPQYVAVLLGGVYMI